MDPDPSMTTPEIPTTSDKTRDLAQRYREALDALPTLAAIERRALAAAAEHPEVYLGAANQARMALEAGRSQVASAALTLAEHVRRTLEAEPALPPRNHLVSVGWTGCKRAYLNVSREDALRRYRGGDLPEGHVDGLEGTVQEIKFTDEFGAYSVHEIEEGSRGC